MAHFRNDSGHALNLDRFGLYVPVDGVFDVYDDDAASLRSQPSFTEVDSAGQPLQTTPDDESGTPSDSTPPVVVPPVVIPSVVIDPAPAAAAVDAPVGPATEDPTPAPSAPVAE